jgi:ankyrin repeat protein
VTQRGSTNEAAIELAAAAFRGDLHQVRALLAAGADINLPGSAWTPLHAAIESGHMPTLELLLASGADPDLPIQGSPPLHHAIDVDMDCLLQRLQRAPLPEEIPEPTIVARLLAAGADPARRDSRGQNALEFAEQYGHTRAVTLLRAHTRVT